MKKRSTELQIVAIPQERWPGTPSQRLKPREPNPPVFSYKLG
jgi:hypothetical protein